MAVISTPQTGKITFTVKESVSGKDVAHNRIFSNIKANATDQDVFDCLNALAGLQALTVSGMSRTTLAELVEA